MVDEERVVRLLDRIRHDVGTLETMRSSGGDALLSDDRSLAAVKYVFITAIEGCTRVAHHIVVSEGWGAPETNAHALAELSSHGVIGADLGERMQRAAGFRNVLVHQYVDVDDARVIDNLSRLDDIAAFAVQVATWLAGGSEST